MKKCFTLAEIMIALTIIGVITAILLPVAQNSLPNEKVMKFKKANATLARVINELVTSGEYYTPGDLGVKADGNVLSSENEDDIKYLCNTFADVITAKETNCIVMTASGNILGMSSTFDIPAWEAENYDYKSITDESCKKIQEKINPQIIANDGIIYYEVSSGAHFGFIQNEYFADEDGNPGEIVNGERRYYTLTHDGFKIIYKMFCIDIDGFNKGEDPFGYGVRVDGKIVLGARTQEWLETDIQDKE